MRLDFALLARACRCAAVTGVLVLPVAAARAMLGGPLPPVQPVQPAGSIVGVGGGHSFDDAAVLAALQAVNETGMQAGQLAQTRGHSDHVRRLGDRLYNDYQLASRKLAGFAERRDIELPERAMVHDEPLASLRAAASVTLDREFPEALRQVTRRAIAAVNQAQLSISDPDLRDFLRRFVPILEQHLDLADHLERSWAGPGAVDDDVES